MATVRGCCRNRSRLNSRPDDLVQLADAFGQACWTRLQDIGGLDLVDVVGANGGDILPAGPRADRFLPDSLAAPGRKDHLGVAARYFQRIDDAILRKPRLREL